MATKIICDICGKDCLDTKFYIPMYKNILCPEASYIFNKEVNLCDACQKAIANFARDKHFEDDGDDRK